MFGDVGNLIGQALSWVAVATGFVSYQMKTTKGILIFQMITAFLFAAHYFLIGANTAAVINFMGVFSGFCYYLREKYNSRTPLVPIVFMSLRWITGIFTWEGWYSLLLLVGLTASDIGLAISKPHTIRKLYLIKSPLCLSYNAIVFSTGGIIYEIATLISAVIGLLGDRKQQQNEMAQGGKENEKI
jgi:hypothetical protein